MNNIDSLNRLKEHEEQRAQRIKEFNILCNLERQKVKEYYMLKDSDSRDYRVLDRLASEIKEICPLVEAAKLQNEHDYRISLQLQEIAEAENQNAIMRRFRAIDGDIREVFKAIKILEKKYEKLEGELVKEFGAAYQQQKRIRFKKIYQALRVAGLED